MEKLWYTSTSEPELEAALAQRPYLRRKNYAAATSEQELETTLAQRAYVKRKNYASESECEDALIMLQPCTSEPEYEAALVTILDGRSFRETTVVAQAAAEVCLEHNIKLRGENPLWNNLRARPRQINAHFDY